MSVSYVLTFSDLIICRYSQVAEAFVQFAWDFLEKK